MRQELHEERKRQSQAYNQECLERFLYLRRLYLRLSNLSAIHQLRGLLHPYRIVVSIPVLEAV